MQRWHPLAGLASQHPRRLHVVFANPFEFHGGVYDSVRRIVDEQDLADEPNVSFLRVARHPFVRRSGPAVVPGWNSSNDEVNATGRHGVYTVFDPGGRMVFHGRTTHAFVEKLVERLVRRR